MAERPPSPPGPPQWPPGASLDGIPLSAGGGLTQPPAEAVITHGAAPEGFIPVYAFQLCAGSNPKKEDAEEGFRQYQLAAGLTNVAGQCKHTHFHVSPRSSRRPLATAQPPKVPQKMRLLWASVAVGQGRERERLRWSCRGRAQAAHLV